MRAAEFAAQIADVHVNATVVVVERAAQNQPGDLFARDDLSNVSHQQFEQIELRRAAENVQVASAQLAQLLSFDPTVLLSPRELAIAPIEIVQGDMVPAELVATGLSNRPELAESRWLAATAVERLRRGRLAQDDRGDGRLRDARVEAQVLEALLEEARVRPEPLDALRLVLQDVDRGEAGGRHGGRMRRGEEERPRPLDEEVAQVLPAGDVAAQDADRRRAELILLGLDVKVQAVELGGEIWHRVQIGPLDSEAKLDAAKTALAENKVEYIVTRLK